MSEDTRSLEFNERELYLLMHATDENARRCTYSDPARSKECWALMNKISSAGGSYVYPDKDFKRLPVKCPCGNEQCELCPKRAEYAEQGRCYDCEELPPCTEHETAAEPK